MDPPPPPTTLGFGMGLKCAVFLANLACYATDKRYAEQEGRKAEEVEHNYRYVDDMFNLTGSVPSEEEYQLKRKVKRAVDNDGHLVFIGADLLWEEDEEGKTRFSTGVHFRDGSYPITIRRYPVRQSVILDTQRLGVLTGQYVRAIRLCSAVRRFKEAVQKVKAAAMRRGYGVREQKRTWTKFLRLWWGAQEVAMGEMEVWFGRMNMWVRAEVQKEEVKARRSWDGWDCKKTKCPYAHTQRPTNKNLGTISRDSATHNHGHNRRPPTAGRRTTTRVGQQRTKKSSSCYTAWNNNGAGMKQW